MSSHSSSVAAMDNVFKWRPSICQVQLPNESGTGILVAPNLLMVPTHVVATDAAAKTASAHFENAPHPFSLELDPDTFFVAHPCHPSTQSSKRFDEAHQDFTLVALKFKEELQEIRPLPIFTEKRPQLKADAYILHYPIARRDSAGQLEVLSREQKLSSQIRAVDQVGQFVIHYHCETFGGSSGALLFTGEGLPYAFHHGLCKDANHKECKLAIPLDSVTRYIKEQHIAIDYFIQSQLIDALRKSYGDKTDIQLLIDDRVLPIGTTYTRLAIISPAEKKEKKEAVKNQTEDIEKDTLPTYESIFQPKEIIEMKDLFERKELRNLEKKRLVVYGSAGIGKTTFSQKIADAWTHEKLWPQFKTLFWIKLRNLNKENYPSSAKKHTIYDMLANECGFNSTTYEPLLKDQNFRQTTLIVLDGYDELPVEATNSRNATHYLAHLITDLQKAFPHFLITTRPQSVQGFGPLQEFEILGFDRQGIDDYVNRFFSPDKDQEKEILLRQLEDPLVYSLCHIPIHLEIFCSLAYEGETFPVGHSLNLGTIYDLLTDWLVRRFFFVHTDKDLDDIQAPDPQNEIEVAATLEALEELAWRALEDNRLYLKNTKDHPEINEAFKNHKLTIAHVKKIGPFKIENNEGQFIHLTFQEFFAARYLVRRIKNPAEYPLAKTIIAEKKFHPRYQLVLMMTAGLLAKDKELLQTFFNLLHETLRDLGEMKELVLLARCFEECGAEAKAISQYPEFIERAVVAFNDDKTNEKIKIDLLSINHHLFEEVAVQERWMTKIQIGDHLFLDSLYEIVKRRTHIPLALIQELTALFSRNGGYHSENILKKIAQTKGPYAAAVLEALVKLLKDPEAKDVVKDRIIYILETTMKNGAPSLPQKAFDVLLTSFLETIKQENRQQRRLLKALVGSQNPFTKLVWKELIALLPTPLEDRQLNLVIEGITEIASGSTSCAREAFEKLSELFLCPRLLKEIVSSLRIVRHYNKAFAQEVDDLLCSVLENPEANESLKKEIFRSYWNVIVRDEKNLPLFRRILKPQIILAKDKKTPFSKEDEFAYELKNIMETEHAGALLEICRNVFFNQPSDKDVNTMMSLLNSLDQKVSNDYRHSLLLALGGVVTEGRPYADKILKALVSHSKKNSRDNPIMILTLIEIVRCQPCLTGTPLGESIALFKNAFRADHHFDTESLLSFLQEISLNPKKIDNELISLLKSLYAASKDLNRGTIASLLVKIAQDNSSLSPKALDALIYLPRTLLAEKKEVRRRFRVKYQGLGEIEEDQKSLLLGVGEVAQGTTPLAEKALDALKKGLEDRSEKHLYIETFAKMIRNGKPFPIEYEMFLDLLFKLFDSFDPKEPMIKPDPFALALAEIGRRENFDSELVKRLLRYCIRSKTVSRVRFLSIQVLEKVPKEKILCFKDALKSLFLDSKKNSDIYQFAETLIDPYLESFQLQNEDEAWSLIQICNRYGRAVYEVNGNYFVSTQRKVVEVKKVSSADQKLG